MAETNSSHIGGEEAHIIPRSTMTGRDGAISTVFDIVGSSPEATEAAAQVVAEVTGETVYAVDPRQQGNRGGKIHSVGLRAWNASWMPEFDKKQEAKRAAIAAEALSIDTQIRGKKQRPPATGAKNN